jgi:hypothetical protein
MSFKERYLVEADTSISTDSKSPTGPINLEKSLEGPKIETPAASETQPSEGPKGPLTQRSLEKGTGVLDNRLTFAKDTNPTVNDTLKTQNFVDRMKSRL